MILKDFFPDFAKYYPSSNRPLPEGEIPTAAWEEKTFELREARFLMELDRDYHKPKPAPPAQARHPIKSELMRTAQGVYSHLQSYTRLSLGEANDPNATRANHATVRVKSVKSVAPQSASAICEVTSVGAADNQLFANDPSFALRVGDTLLITFMVAVSSECEQPAYQEKKAKVKPGALFRIHSPAVKVIATAEGSPASKLYRACLIVYRFSHISPET